ncbi:hypothetical protein [Streptomyces sp. NRRL F-5126]|uniref:hypothetical protein n=1 Tax=Streptomyces sp. NRRL F-5126 TaxID=1463857 RepID=UPI000691E7C4|nr:hypothetical protein [Streptomyces sp. NRRL F-5126]
MTLALTRAERTARDLAYLDDTEFGARLLASTPVHAGRDHGLLREWAAAAAAFGTSLPAAPPVTARVVERDGGLALGMLARYRSRPATVELYTDAIAAAEELVDRLGWRALFPRGCVRTAALAHEAVHERLHHGPGKAELKRALGHVVLSFGGRQVYGYVAGADEIAAHACAARTAGLGRSPLLLAEALSAIAAPPGAEAAGQPRDRRGRRRR